MFCRHNGIYHQHKRDGGQYCSGKVDFSFFCAALKQQSLAEQQDNKPCGDIDQKYPVPGEPFCNHTTEENSGGSTSCCRGSPKSESAIELFWIGKFRHDQGEGGRSDQGRAQSL
ncbi:hypothetical protein D3C81_1810010 [compost metagenome]